MPLVADLRLEHYHPPNLLGIHETRPRLSWNVQDDHFDFDQAGYDVQWTAQGPLPGHRHTLSRCVTSPHSDLVPWPFEHGLQSRQQSSIQIRVWDAKGQATLWSPVLEMETGLLDRSDWVCGRIAAPWAASCSDGPGPEQLFRKTFALSDQATLHRARLYITAQGVYEAEINGSIVGDHFLAPGWTSYAGRIQYQTYNVTKLLNTGQDNCIGVRVAEGWFNGRLGFRGGNRNIWGSVNSLFMQLELNYTDGRSQTVITDGSWKAVPGLIRLAEIYDGEKYDATWETPLWSSPGPDDGWESVRLLPPLPASVKLVAGYGEPVRRIQVVQPVAKILTPSGRTVLDFGQNLVGYLRLRGIKGPRGHKIILPHAEVLEHGELGTRPLRFCEARDEYTLRGTVPEGESETETEMGTETYEPRFTFHGFRYAQIDGWRGELDITQNFVEAVVCHTDMRPVGGFSCSEPILNKLHSNIVWSMRDNFLSVPTDCPQRDERLGWTGDLALFAPSACLLYDCYGMLKNWLIDVEFDQGVLGGVPPMVSPNSTLPDPVWCRRVPCAVWHDVTILAPWALYQETGDVAILAQQYRSMETWMKVLARAKTGLVHLWDREPFQLGDWLDPSAPPDAPWKGATDSKMVSNMFLIQSLDLMARISDILGRPVDKEHYALEHDAALAEFHSEFVTATGRLVSDSQAAYALAICLDLLSPEQQARAGERLVELVRKSEFRIGTGFAGTPYLCEALARTNHIQVAYSMLLERTCPSWLYPVTMGATTVWERWDSMLPDGSINPGDMTSFNHYAFGAIVKFMHERVAGLQRLEPGWTRCRMEPAIGAEFTSASASHVSRLGRISVSWETARLDDEWEEIRLEAEVPSGVRVEVVLPEGGHGGSGKQEAGPGKRILTSKFMRRADWPVLPLKGKS